VQEFLRHKMQSATARYLHIMSRGIKQAVKVLDENIVRYCNVNEHAIGEKKEG